MRFLALLLLSSSISVANTHDALYQKSIEEMFPQVVPGFYLRLGVTNEDKGMTYGGHNTHV